LSGCGPAPEPSAAGPAASTTADDDYVVPRTPWGDPDLQGIWPGTHMVGVPMQRPEALGTRNVLTDEEFAAAKAKALGI